MTHAAEDGSFEEAKVCVDGVKEALIAVDHVELLEYNSYSQKD